MRKLLFILILLPMICNSQNYISIGSSIIMPETDTGNEYGISISTSFNHNVDYIIFQPTISISQFKGIDNELRRNRQYSYNTTLFTAGLNIMNTGRFYGVLGVHYNANIVSSKFKLEPNQYDKVARHNLFLSEYIGIGYHSLINIEFGIFYTNTNYLEGYYPITSKHNDVYLQLKLSYDIVLNKYKCKCLNNN